ncbi:MAG TPA: beta-ketoacyl-[acyl-carrier-protein] synthase family protein [Verrucomicrobiae bacterium]|nr:beta-ketoacyl-[acyl-carrier-protein] synthase family protein [Verrucomicrobiae bacterium]
MNKRRVVITGIGIISPLGIGLEEFWVNVLAGKSGVDRCPALVKSDCPWKIAGEVHGFRPEEWLTRKDVKRMDRFTQFGLVSSHMAIQDAGLDLAREDCTRIGLALGTAYSGWGFAAQEYDAYKTKGFEAMSAYTSIAVFTGSCGGQISLHLGLHASSLTIATGCDCASAAIAQAADMILSNDVDIMLAGGAEAPIQPIVVAAVGTSHAMSARNAEPTSASRPFDQKRDGFVMSEGAGVLIIEELEHALRRRARVYAELTGWASTCDGYHMCQPDPEGTQAVRGLQLALDRAGVRPEKVDYLNAHGTSTPLGDKAETIVVKSVFGEHAYNVPISSIKSSLGHMQGACGSVEVAACCLAIRDNILPPTINYEYPDPECDLDFVPNVARHRRVDVAVSNSLGFGGRNTALVVERFRGQHANGANGKNREP